jgi:hypothetical protein
LLWPEFLSRLHITITERHPAYRADDHVRFVRRNLGAARSRPALNDPARRLPDNSRIFVVFYLLMSGLRPVCFGAG